jgi:hypothetical protein
MRSVDRPVGSRDSRGTTTALNYVLLLTVVALLVSGLFIGIRSFVESQEEQAVRSQLRTVGTQFAADIATANRLATTAGGDRVRLRSDLPDTAGGNNYRITARDIGGNRSQLVLRSHSADVRTTVTVRSAVPVTGAASGGSVLVE